MADPGSADPVDEVEAVGEAGDVPDAAPRPGVGAAPGGASLALAASYLVPPAAPDVDFLAEAERRERERFRITGSGR